MKSHGIQISLMSMLLVVACVALNLWLFRLSVLFGILGLNVTKHVVIALLCKTVGVDGPAPPPEPAQAPNPGPSQGPSGTFLP